MIPRKAERRGPTQQDSVQAQADAHIQQVKRPFSVLLGSGLSVTVTHVFAHRI